MKEKKQKATNHNIKNKPKDFLIPIITSLVFIALIFTPSISILTAYSMTF